MSQPYFKRGTHKTKRALKKSLAEKNRQNHDKKEKRQK